MDRNYTEYYEKISEPFRSEKRTKLINVLNLICTYVVFAAYPVFLICIYLYRREDLLKQIAVPAVSFLAVTLFREVLNRQRPYEKYPIDPLIRKEKKGRSMPSRHIFSSAVIAMAVLSEFPVYGAALLIVTVIASVLRVVGGVHYPQDVAAGFLLGVAAGLILFL